MSLLYQIFGYLSIKEIEDKLPVCTFRSCWYFWVESKEDVESHSIDPEHEGGDGVEGDIAHEYTGRGVIGKKICKVSAEEATCQANIGYEVIGHKADGDLAKERAVKVVVYDVGHESDEEEHRGY